MALELEPSYSHSEWAVAELVRVYNPGMHQRTAQDYLVQAMEVIGGAFVGPDNEGDQDGNPNNQANQMNA